MIYKHLVISRDSFTETPRNTPSEKVTFEIGRQVDADEGPADGVLMHPAGWLRVAYQLWSKCSAAHTLEAMHDGTYASAATADEDLW